MECKACDKKDELEHTLSYVSSQYVANKICEEIDRLKKDCTCKGEDKCQK